MSSKKEGKYPSQPGKKRKVSTDSEDVQASDHHITSRPKKRSFSIKNIFKKKNTCERCGKELEYKEGMGSYYCSECHTYYRGEK